MNILSQVENIQQKLQQLLKKQELLQKENDALRKELKIASEKEVAHLENIKDLQQKMHVAQLGTQAQTWNDEDKKALQKKIDKYLKDIDHCLQQLHSA